MPAHLRWTHHGAFKLLLLVAWSASSFACAAPVEEIDPEFNRYDDLTKNDGVFPEEGSVEALGILRVANESDETTLIFEAEVAVISAASLVQHREANDRGLCIWSGSSYYGVCGEPHADGVIVTNVTDQNPLGLLPGDRVMRVNSQLLADAAATTTLLRVPLCGGALISPSSQRDVVASTIFSLLYPDDELEVIEPSGATRLVRVPRTDASFCRRCSDPLGRDTSGGAEGYVRGDGIGVVRVPSFMPGSGAVDGEFDEALEETLEPLREAFARVRHAPGIIWDLRGNVGGLTHAGLTIVNGMPSARATDISTCLARAPGTHFDYRDGGNYWIQPGGDFSYDGEVAVLIDGGAVSAADYFALAVRRATDVPIFGKQPVGGYGSSSLDHSIGRGWSGGSDIYLCQELDGTVLEGMAITPDVTLDYDPQSLREGRDSMMDFAAAHLLDD